MERRAFAGIALDPNLAAHEFGQTLADREPQPCAAIMTGGRGIDLLEGFEKPILALEGNANAGIAHGEVQQPLFRMTDEIGVIFMAERGAARATRSGRNVDHDFTLVREFNGVTDEIDQDLAQPGDIADQYFW